MAAAQRRAIITKYPEIENLRKQFSEGETKILKFYRKIEELNNKTAIPGAGGDEQEAMTEKYLIEESKLDELLKDIRGWRVKFEIDLYKYIDDLEAKRIASYSSPTDDTAPTPVWQDDDDEEVPVGAGSRKLSRCNNRRNKKQKKFNKSRKSHK
jgi:hypothetical protein